jgi:hypothetical protein
MTSLFTYPTFCPAIKTVFDTMYLLGYKSAFIKPEQQKVCAVDKMEGQN